MANAEAQLMLRTGLYVVLFVVTCARSLCCKLLDAVMYNNRHELSVAWAIVILKDAVGPRVKRL